MNQKDKKFISALAFAQVGLIWLGISLSDWFWHGALLKALEMKKTYEIGQWATEEVEKSQADKKLKELKKNYELQGISAEEF